jgi:hypothetical protein
MQVESQGSIEGNIKISLQAVLPEIILFEFQLKSYNVNLLDRFISKEGIDLFEKISLIRLVKASRITIKYRDVFTHCCINY